MVAALLSLIWLQCFSLDAQRQRVFDESRSGNLPGLKTRLMQARADRVISENEYFGELAHMLGYEPAKAWPWFLEIAQSGNAYGQEVMLSHLAGNPDFSASLTPAQRQAAIQQVEAIEPALPGGEVDLGLFDLSTYANWVEVLKQFHGDDFNAWAQTQVLREQHPKTLAVLQYAWRHAPPRLSPAAQAKLTSQVQAFVRQHPNSLASRAANDDL